MAARHRERHDQEVVAVGAEEQHRRWGRVGALGTPEGPVAVAHAKRFSPDAALRAAITASELLGAYGWHDDHDPARLISLAKMLQVVDGTAEIQRIVIARELVRRVDGA